MYAEKTYYAHWLNCGQDAVTESLVASVKDLMPELGDGFVMACLAHFNVRTCCRRISTDFID